MKYNLLLSHKFDRDFSRLEKALQGRVVEGLRELYQIQEEKLLVFAISVSHRKHVYD